MEGRTLLKKLSKLRYAELLAHEADMHAEIARYSMLKKVLVTSIGATSATVVKALLLSTAFGLIEYFCSGVLLLSSLGYCVFNELEAYSVASKALCDDLISLRKEQAQARRKLAAEKEGNTTKGN